MTVNRINSAVFAAGLAFASSAAAERPPVRDRTAPPRFEITFPAAAHAGPITGRLVLVIAKAAQPELRLAISPRGPAIFAIDIDQLAPNKAAVIDETSLGYPMTLSALPAGDYFAQAVISVYEQVHRADGKTLWLPMNDGNIEFFSNAAGNLYSDVVPIHIGTGGAITINVSHVLPAYQRPKDTEWVKQVSFQSPMLTKFWVARSSSMRRCFSRRAMPSIGQPTTRACTRSATVRTLSLFRQRHPETARRPGSAL